MAFWNITMILKLKFPESLCMDISQTVASITIQIFKTLTVLSNWGVLQIMIKVTLLKV